MADCLTGRSGELAVAGTRGARGTIWLDEQPAQGSTLRFTLAPAATSSEAVEASRQAPAPAR